MKTWKQALIVAVAAGGLMIVGACAHHERVYVGAETYADTGPYYYYYYPGAEVYFEPSHRVYWWHEGGVWRSGPAAPSRYRLGGEVRFRWSDPEPWRHHDVIVRRYGHHHDRDRDRDDDDRRHDRD